MWPAGTLNSGKGVGDAIDLDVAASGDIDGAGDGFGNFAKDLGHFLSGLEIELVGGELHAMRVAHGLAGLDAEQDFLSVSVVVVEIVAIVGGDEGDAGFFGETNELRVDALFDGEALILNLEEEIAFAEDVAEAVGVFAGLVEFVVDDTFGDGAAETGAESDEAFGMFAEEIVIDARLVVEAFEEAGGNELDEIVIALEILAEKDEVIAAACAGFEIVAIFGGGAGFFAAVVAAALGDVDFATDDGLDVALAGFIEEIGGGEEVAVVGDGHGGHFLARGLVEKLGGFAGSVQEAEIGVDVQMNKLGIAHGI